MTKVNTIEELDAFKIKGSRYLVGPIETGSTAEEEIENSPIRQGMTCVAYWASEYDKPVVGSNQQYASISGSYKAVLVRRKGKVATKEQQQSVRDRSLRAEAEWFAHGGYDFQGMLVIGTRLKLTFLGLELPATQRVEIEAKIVDHYIPHNDGCWVLEMVDGRIIHLDPYSANQHVGASEAWSKIAQEDQLKIEEGLIPPGKDYWCYYGQTGVGDALAPTPEGDDSEVYNEDFKDGRYEAVPEEDRVQVPIGIDDPTLYGQVLVELIER